ncbi:MAG: hypothetical protein JWO95_710 [Verrucomicrobiales bacterium]|nr:hypothetical protein [Verrucomicrobiales bacterium]
MRLTRLLTALLLFSLGSDAVAQTNLPASVRNVDIALQAKEDFWGQIAAHQPGGPSYEFFSQLMPPLRYVDAAFHYYPIVLSAPDAPLKARLISNGSAINARASKATWKDYGLPITFKVGDDGTDFGADLTALKGPTYDRGYLPIVNFSYYHKGHSYEEEVFASVDRLQSDSGVVFVRFKNPTNAEINIAAVLSPNTPLTVSEGAVRNTNSYAWLWFDKSWQWDPARNALTTKLFLGEYAYLAIASQPMAQPVRMADLPGTYDEQRRSCAGLWESYIRNGMSLTVPEPLVNNVWRAQIIANYMLMKGDNANYSYGNAYERLYEAECGDTVRALMLYGYTQDTRRMMVPLLNYSRTNGNYSLRFHQAAYKLQMLAHYYWLTRDAGFINDHKTEWQREVDLLSTNRESGLGILPKEQYAGDIFDRAYSLNSNANGWRGLRDMAAVLIETGNREQGEPIAAVARDFRKAILTAVDKSINDTVMPPFIPLALLGNEKPYDPITATKMGSYWNLMAPYVIGSGIFGPGDERQTWLIDYLQKHGGISMGMIRFDQHSGLFANKNGIDDLYSLRYVDKLAERDDVDGVLNAFYGKMAQGMTRDTFIGGEGSSFKALDGFGRPMYLPPNSTGNAFFLWTLRDMLVQDWDLNDDGKPETLRLMFDTPRRWLNDGQEIAIDRAPTAFGPVSARIVSKLSSGQVIADVRPPMRNPAKQSLLRLRLPENYVIRSADVEGVNVPFDNRGTLDITAFKDRFTVRCRVEKVR